MGGARPLLARRPRIHHDPRRAAVAPRPAPHPARTTHPAATHQPTSRRRTRRRRGRGLTSTPTEDLYAASITPLVRRHRVATDDYQERTAGTVIKRPG